MKNAGWLMLAILVTYACAIVAPLPRHQLRNRTGALIGWCFVPVIFACPLLIPPAHVGLRAASAFASGDICVKMADYFRHWATIDRGVVLRDYYRFLIPFPVLAAAFPDHKRRLLRPQSPWPHVARVLGGTAGFAIALLTVRSLSGNILLRSSFALNHAVMLLIFVVAIESLSRAICGLERLAGFDTQPIIKNAFLSRSVAEFWRRYNYRIHDWLYRNVFQPAGGRRAPVRSILLAFLVSGLFHEVAFAMATSRLTGYQLAFFTIQGPAALASGRLERLARRGGFTAKILAHASTILFLAATSVLFFDGVSNIFPFIYAAQSPLPPGADLLYTETRQG
jgi:hypothetical protein